MNGFAIEASNGQLGIVSNLLFEDVGWDVRWFVVDTGSWLSGRKVLLPLSALGQPDLTLRCFPVKLTMQQVKNSPEVDTEHPVSRQTETQLYKYYGPHWEGGNLRVSAIAKTFFAPLWSPVRGAGGEDVRHKGGNADLCSVEEVMGYRVCASDGEIGHIEDFLMDEASWNIRYIVVDTRNWRHGQNVLVSSRSVIQVDWKNKTIHLLVERMKVKDSPSYDPTSPIDRAYEENFLTYYGMQWETGNA